MAAAVAATVDRKEAATYRGEEAIGSSAQNKPQQQVNEESWLPAEEIRRNSSNN